MTISEDVAAALPPGFDADSIFRSLFIASPDALLVVDGNGTIVLANPGALRLLGFEAGELAGANVDMLVPQAVRSEHASFRHGYARSPTPRPMGTRTELVARRKDGSEVMVEIALSPLHSQGLPLVLAAIRGIDAYPRVQQALKRARHSELLAEFGRLIVDARDPRAVLDRVPKLAVEALAVDVAMVFLIEKDHQHLRVASGIGMVPGEEVGKLLPYRTQSTPGLVLSQERPLRVEDYRTETRFEVPPAYLDAGLTSALAVPIADRGQTIGALSVRSRARRSFDDDELRFLVSLANLLAVSLQSTEFEEALQHAQRLESVGQLTGGIAHDFNNLLTVIQGNLQVLEEHAPLTGDPIARPLLDAAMRAARRSAELTSKLLAFSRRQMLQPSPVDLVQLLEALAGMLRRTLDQQIRIEVEIPAGCPPVLVDQVQLESALLNIAINARDAMPDGGVLRFRAEVLAALPPAIPHQMGDGATHGKGFIAISITDAGTGMTEEVRKRALEPFFTTKEIGRGTGLGLSTVYGFARQSHGALTIDSTIGVGTTVTLYIPQAAAGEPPGNADGRDPIPIPPGLRVLLVEDDPEVRTVITNFLQSFGCETAAAANAEQALLIQDSEPAFDLLLSDISLGTGMRGTELAAHMQQRAPLVAILLMSGFSSELIEADRDIPQSWELLPKPCTRQELAAAIIRVLTIRNPSSAP